MADFTKTSQKNKSKINPQKNLKQPSRFPERRWEAACLHSISGLRWSSLDTPTRKRVSNSVLIEFSMTALLSVVVVVGGIFLGLYLWEKKRTEKMSQAAAEMGMPFYAKGDDALIGELANFQLFKQGRSKKTKNMLHGESSNVEVGVFDYQYTVGSGKNSRRYKQTVAYFQSAALDCPDFALRPENFFHKIGNLFGYQDIDFESHPQFSSSYILRGTSEHRIRKDFTDAILSFFEDQPGLCVEG